MIETMHMDKLKPIKGFPELRWAGKRPLTELSYFPAQLRETYGKPSEDGWFNKLFWGDNLQVMGHLLRDYRGKIDLVYIDPPFDSKADYKRKIKVKGRELVGDSSVFEEKQYSDIWTNDEYLQFMYDRLILCRELLSEKGSIYLHCDWHKNHHLRMLMDEIFQPEKFRNEIIWGYFGFKRATTKKFPQKHDVIYSYSKSDEYTWNVQFKPHSDDYIARFKKDENGRLYRDDVNPTGGGTRIIYLDEIEGDIIDSNWDDIPLEDLDENLVGSHWQDIPPVNPQANERQNYPTQKPEKLLERIIKSSTNEGDIVFDCFMGAGTTQNVALKLGRKFIGNDINLSSVRITTKRLNSTLLQNPSLIGFSVYNVNNYEIFKNPVEGKEIIIEALSIDTLKTKGFFDGVKDDWLYKIMPINRIATSADLHEIIKNIPYEEYKRRQEENPGKAVGKIRLVCMGHEPDLKAKLVASYPEFEIKVEVIDLLKNKSQIEFKLDSEASITLDKDKLEIKDFFPRNLLQKSSLVDGIDDWRSLVESVVIDWDYNGKYMDKPQIDLSTKLDKVVGSYEVPKNIGKQIKVQIVDLLSEIYEEVIQVNG